MTDLPIEEQMTFFMIGYGMVVGLAMPFVVMHFARRAAAPVGVRDV